MAGTVERRICLVIAGIAAMSGSLFFALFSPCLAMTINLQWSAVTDPSVVGYRVHYQADSAAQPFRGTGAIQGVSPIDVQARTTAFLSGLDTAHPHFFAITAYNAAGVESDYSNMVYVPELMTPTTAIISPANGATVSGSVPVAATASDNVGVTRVDFLVNDVLKGTCTTVPYAFTWDTTVISPGTYYLITRAYDAANNMGQTDPVMVTVVRDTTPPVVALTSPAQGSKLSGTVTVAAQATDNRGVATVEFLDGGHLIAAMNTPPYSFPWDTSILSPGSHILSARVSDTSHNTSQSGTVTVNVVNDNSSAPIRLNDTGYVTYHQSFTSAYQAIVDGSSVLISARAGVSDENLVLNRNISFKLVGGYDPTFSSIVGITQINGSMTVSGGTCIFEGVGM